MHGRFAIMPDVFLTTEAAQERVVLRIFFCSFIFNTSSVKYKIYIRILYSIYIIQIRMSTDSHYLVDFVHYLVKNKGGSDSAFVLIIVYWNSNRYLKLIILTNYFHYSVILLNNIFYIQ